MYLMSQMLPRISSQRRKRTRYLLLMLFGVLFVHISLNVVSFLGAGWTKRSNSESCGTGIDDLPTNVRRISQKVNGSLEILLNLDVNMQQDSLSGDAAMIDQVIHFLQDKLKDLNIHLNTTKLKDLDGDQHKDTKTKGYQEGSMDSAQILHNATTPAYITHNTTGEFTPHAPPMNTTFVLNSPDLCRNSPDLEYIIYVHTAPANSDRRKVMRSTWASPSLFKRNITKLVFMMGMPGSPDILRTLQEEHSQHRDIVQGSFMESYRNLLWLSNGLLLTATDDDAFGNIFELMRLVNQHSHIKKMILCPMWKENSQPILRDRSTCLNWCVEEHEFPNRTGYPQYCAGINYIMSHDLVPELYRASFSTGFFWVDDVYATGILPRKVQGVQYVNIMDRLIFSDWKTALEEYKDLSQNVTHILVHCSPGNHLKLWNATLNRLSVKQLSTLNDKVFIEHPHLRKKLK